MEEKEKNKLQKKTLSVIYNIWKLNKWISLRFCMSERFTLITLDDLC